MTPEVGRLLPPATWRSGVTGALEEVLGLERAEVSAVATFYSQFRRHPVGTYHVGVCTNALCAVMGGDEIWKAVTEHTGLGAEETSEDGTISLERVECNAACDYAPVVMVNWEFFDNQTPDSAVAMIKALERGEDVAPTRGPETVPTFRENERLLAGFEDGRTDGDLAFAIDRTTTAEGAYPVFLVSYLIGCEQYEDENVAALTKGFFQTAVSEAGQDSAAKNAGSAPISDDLREKSLAAIALIK